MAFVVPMVTAAATALGGTTAAAVGTALSVGGAVYGGVASYQAASFQQDILTMQAEQGKLNADAQRMQGAVSAQEADFAAIDQMEQLLARQGATGFDVGSGSFARRRTENRVLADLDRTRIVEGAETNALNLEQRAQGNLLEAELAGMGKTNAVASTVLNVGSSLITGAGKVNDAAARKIRRDNVEAG